MWKSWSIRLILVGELIGVVAFIAPITQMIGTKSSTTFSKSVPFWIADRSITPIRTEMPGRMGKERTRRPGGIQSIQAMVRELRGEDASSITNCNSEGNGPANWIPLPTVLVRHRSHFKERVVSISSQPEMSTDALAPVVLRRRSELEPIAASLQIHAGSFDDRYMPPSFHAILARTCNRALLEPDRIPGHSLVIHVRDQNRRPVPKARVVAGNWYCIERMMRIDGDAIITPADWLKADSEIHITVHSPDDWREFVNQTLPPGTRDWTVQLPIAQSSLPKNLDLAIVLDTTDGMAAELDYLKSQLKSIVMAIHNQFPQVKQRYALVVFRDHFDEYVTRTFGFTDSFDDFHRNLSFQRAEGGKGDPAGIGESLEKAAKLDWSTENTARVLFFVADAPPHAKHMYQTLTAAGELQRKGVVIFPVACGGCDTTCEFIMRRSALMTGGQFIFLTDDSGVGNANAGPHMPYYQVQRLDQLMIRMIAGELAGKRVEPKAEDVMRTVGKVLGTNGQ